MIKALKKNLGKVFSLLTAIFSFTCIPCLIFPFLVGIGAGSIATRIAFLTKGLLIFFITFAIVGFSLKFKKHQNPTPLILSILGGATIFYFNFVTCSSWGMRIGALFMISAAISDVIFKKRKKCDSCK